MQEIVVDNCRYPTEITYIDTHSAPTHQMKCPLIWFYTNFNKYSITN